MEDKVVRLPAGERQTLQDKVYGELREALMSGQFRPGEALRLQEIADRLGTSIMPVREALKRLAAEQALSYEAGRSIRVPRTTVEDLDKLYAIRFALEGLAAETAADFITVKDLKALTKYNETMRTQLLSPHPEKMLWFNREFHMTVYRATQSDLLLSMIETLWLRAGPLLNAYRVIADDALKSIDCHRELIEALEQRDGKWARRAMEHVLTVGYQGIRTWLST